MNFRAACRLLLLICEGHCLKTEGFVKQLAMLSILSGATKTCFTASINEQIVFLRILNWHQTDYLLKRNWQFLSLFEKNYLMKYSPKNLNHP